MRRNGVIYARYSSSAQNESSIEQQLIVCYEYAKKNDILIVGEYIDKALSGRSDERPDFQRMLKDAQKRQWEYVIVYKLDRFSRNRYDSAIHNKTLKKCGVKRLSATENISDAPEGILMESVLEGMAEYYSIELSQKINRGLDDNVRKGLMVGGSVTYGYQLVNKKLIPDDNAMHVQYIFNAYAQGKTMDDIILNLNAKGVLNVNNAPFSHQHISKILHNKRYIGTFTYKGIEYPDFIPPIIDSHLFEVVQGKLKQVRNYGKRKSDFTFVLTGKLWCGHCGKSMCGITAKNRHGVRYGYYICRTGDISRWKKLHLEELVASVIAQSVLEPKYRDELIDDIVDQANKVDLVVATEIEQLKRQIASTKKKINHLLTAVKQGIISQSLQQDLSSHESQIEMLNLEISKRKQTRQVNVDIDKLYYFFEQLYERRNTAEGVEFIIKTFVRKVILWDDRMTVHFDLTGKSPLDKTVEFNADGVIKNATQVHHLLHYNNPIGYLRPKVYLYGYHVFITVILPVKP
jgi:DNA invertase Pin-like site-specific DNA recombinase